LATVSRYGVNAEGAGLAAAFSDMT
jgi:hypothetical protein